MDFKDAIFKVLPLQLCKQKEELKNRNNSYKRYYINFFFSCDPQQQTHLFTAPVLNHFTFVNTEAFTLLGVSTATNCNKAIKGNRPTRSGLLYSIFKFSSQTNVNLSPAEDQMTLLFQ